LLSHNVRANELKHVTLKNLACGDNTGEIRIALGINSFIATEPRKTEVLVSANWEINAEAYKSSEVFARVKIVKLDDDLRSAGPISLLKIDCEGFEYHVLSGAMKLLELYKPLLFVELHPQLFQTTAIRWKKSVIICDLLTIWNFGTLVGLNVQVTLLFVWQGDTFMEEKSFEQNQPCLTAQQLHRYPHSYLCWLGQRGWLVYDQNRCTRD
jgi:FkbM family methyltransferase